MFVGENLEKLEYIKQREQRLEHCLVNLKLICRNLVKDDFIFSFKFFFLESIIAFLKKTLVCINKKVDRVSMINLSDNEMTHLDAQQNDIIIDHIDKLSEENTGEHKIKELRSMHEVMRLMVEDNPRYSGEWDKLNQLVDGIFEPNVQNDLLQVWSYISTLRLNTTQHSNEIVFMRSMSKRLQKTFYQLMLMKSGVKTLQEWNWNQRYQRVLLVFRAKMLILRILKNLNFYSDGFVQARNFMASYQSLFDGTLFFKQLMKKKELAQHLPNFSLFERYSFLFSKFY
jgi:hypothetical protein